MSKKRHETSKNLSPRQSSKRGGKIETQRMIQPELFSDDILDNAHSDPKDGLDNMANEHDDEIEHDDDTTLYPTVGLEDEDEQTVMTIHQDDLRSVGQMLAEARNQLKLTIEDVANDTHIRNDYIKYLEANKFEKLPTASIYTKSYIRSLCRLYNLNSDILISKYEEAFFASRQAKTSDNDKQKQPVSCIIDDDDDDDPPRKKQLRLTLSWAVAILVCIIAFITLIYAVTRKTTIDESINSPNVKLEGSLITDAELDQFITPEQLPLSELSIPDDEE